MKVRDIIDGLRFINDMFMTDSLTGEVYKQPRNDLDKYCGECREAAVII